LLLDPRKSFKDVAFTIGELFERNGQYLWHFGSSFVKSFAIKLSNMAFVKQVAVFYLAKSMIQIVCMGYQVAATLV